MKHARARLAWLASIGLIALLHPASRAEEIADKCKPLRLDVGSNPIAKMPVLDQKNYGTCYAQTAAQMLTAKLRSLDPEKYKNIVISPMSLALSYLAEHRGKTSMTSQAQKMDFEGGNGQALIRSGLKVCELSAIEGKYFDSNSDDIVFDAETGKSISVPSGSQRDQILLLQKIIDGFFKTDKSTTQVSAVAREICSKANVHNRNLRDIEDLLKESIKADSSILALQNLVEGDCEKIKLPDDFVILGKSSAKPHRSADKVVEFIDRLFDGSSASSVGLSYCANVLTDENRSANVTTKFGFLTPSENCEIHSSIIVGRELRRASDGSFTCKYLIRNSWGPTCDGYSTSIRNECDNGQVWIEKEHLKFNILDAYAIE